MFGNRIKPTPPAPDRRRNGTEIVDRTPRIPLGTRQSDGLVTAQARVVALQEQLTAAEREKLDISTHVHDLETLLQEERLIVHKLQGQLRKSEAECDHLRLALRDAKLDGEERSRTYSKMHMQLETLQQELADSRASNARLRKQLDELEAQLITTRSQLRAAEEELEGDSLGTHELERRLQQNNALHDKLTLEKNAEIARLLGTIESLNAELHLVKSLPASALVKSNSTEHNIAHLLSRIDMLESQLAAKTDTLRSRTSTGSKGGYSSHKDVEERPAGTRPVRQITLGSQPAWPQPKVHKEVGVTSRVAVPRRQEYRPSSPERSASPLPASSPLNRLEAALTGITARDDRLSPSRPGRQLSAGKRYSSSPSHFASGSGQIRSRSLQHPSTSDVLLRTYPHNRHMAYDGGMDVVRPTSPPRQWAADLTADPDPRTSTYPSRRPFASNSELHDELEAVKRETARLRRELP